MSDFKWLESELARQLNPVAAPGDLWRGLQAGRAQAEISRRPGGLVLWPVVAALLLVASVGLLWELNKARGAQGGNGELRDMAQFSPAELREWTAGTGTFDFRSNDPAAIRKWVKANGNIDIELPPAPSGAARIRGVRMVDRDGARIAAVTFQIEGSDESATLLVSKRGGVSTKDGRTPKHQFRRAAAGDGRGAPWDMVSWDMGEQVYTIAWDAGGLEGVCGLCHADGPRKL